MTHIDIFIAVIVGTVIGRFLSDAIASMRNRS
jgi:hypothetical protein